MSKIGLERGTVKIVNSDYATWSAEFEKEAQLLINNLGSYISEIHHTGSTSIPGLDAKPIIDIIAVVDNLDVYKEMIEPLEKLGYSFMTDRVFDIKDRVFFPKGPTSNRTHHLSLVPRGGNQHIDTLLFRDYLRSNLRKRGQYQTLKKKLAKLYPNDRESYTKAKEKFIRETLNEARLKIKK